MFSFDLHENEKLFKMYRQTESVLIKPAALVLVFIYVPIWYLLKYELLQTYAWFLGIWTLAVLLYAINTYMLWLVNVYLITTKRIVCVEYSTLFRKQTDELLIGDIANIRQKTSGIFSSILGFGTLELEGGGSQPLRMENLQNPGEIKDFIWKIKEGRIVARRNIQKNEPRTVK
jgi:hypothetical protein